jgi:hypothetical protein
MDSYVGDWCGTPTALLDNFQKLNDRLHVLNDRDVPTSATALGIALTKAVLPLKALGIDLFRPKPTATERLWAWRRLEPNSDTCDAFNHVANKRRSDASPTPNNYSAQVVTADALSIDEEMILRILTENKHEAPETTVRRFEHSAPHEMA